MPREGGGAGSQVSPFSTVKTCGRITAPQLAALNWEIKGGGREQLLAETPVGRVGVGVQESRNGGQAGSLGNRLEAGVPTQWSWAGWDALPRGGWAVQPYPARRDATAQVPSVKPRTRPCLSSVPHPLTLPALPSQFLPRRGRETPQLVPALVPPCQRGLGWSR